jgi:hypothetical protein
VAAVTSNSPIGFGLLLGCLLCCPSCGGTTPRDVDDRATAADSRGAMSNAASSASLADELMTAALDGQAFALLEQLTTVAPKRISGSAEAARAVEWGLSTMRTIGLVNVRAEPIMVPRWERGPAERCELLDSSGATAEELSILALGGSEPTPERGIEAEVMMVRSFEELRERAEEARGRIVFFNRPMPRVLASTFRAYGQAVPQRSSGAIEAGKVGGVFALVRSMTTRIDDHPHTGAMHYADGVPRVPSAAISTLDAEALGKRLRDGERVRLRITMGCRTLPDVESANVVGEIVGATEPDSIVVVGGHLDSWDVGTGAQDDGAGISHTLEAARLLAARGSKPRRTIRFVLFMNEENGLRGGRGYREANGEQFHLAAIESDAGADVPLGFGTTASDDLRASIAPHFHELAGFGAGALTAGGGGADIGPLGDTGCVLFGLSVISHRYFDYHHSELDVIDSVNERALALGAGAMAWLALQLADGPIGDRIARARGR